MFAVTFRHPATEAEHALVAAYMQELETFNALLSVPDLAFQPKDMDLRRMDRIARKARDHSKVRLACLATRLQQELSVD